MKNPTKGAVSHRRTIPFTLLWLALTGFSPVNLPAAEAPATPPASVLLTVEGRVEVARRGLLDWAPATPNQELQTGDRVRTGLKSRATLRLSDLSVVRLDQLTVLEIRASQGEAEKAGLGLKGGSTYFFNRDRPGTTRFETPTASGAIRGTEFNLAVAEDGTTVVTLLDGEVLLTAEQGSLSLKSGEEGTVRPNQPPTKTAVIDAINVIQWALYYPAVVDPEELGLSAGERSARADSLKAYREGDLLRALADYPADRLPQSDAEKVFHAGLLLAAGRVTEAEADLSSLQSTLPAANAIRELIAAVKNQALSSGKKPATGSEWLAHSYRQQSRGELEAALTAAREAVKLAPGFGAAHLRVAELEFGFGRTAEAISALGVGLLLSPNNAQGLALRGFLLAAQGHIPAAETAFEQAIAVDGALGNAWLGRGLARIRSGRVAEGRKDLQVAATLEPQRSLLRSYLGKAWSVSGNPALARKELDLAGKLDPADPTPWLYSALLAQQQNRLNDGLRELERSKELNDNRGLYRSKLLLDQDRAVRSANLAALYRDTGLSDFSLREASRAVSYDYGNHSSHLFLAESYDALRDRRTLNLRYETPFFSELLVSQLLAPVGAGNLSQNISQQEYSRFFESRSLGIFSATEYLSLGDWTQAGSQFGVLGNTSYSFDAFYRTQNGQRPNNDFEQRELSLRLKQQLTPASSVFLQITDYQSESGDILQYHDPAQANRGLRVKEEQEPNLYAGFHHEWSPGVHTLVLGARLHDDLTATNPFAPTLTLIRNGGGTITNVVLSPQNPNSARFRNGFESEFVTYSAELQQIWQQHRHTLIVGARYQSGRVETDDLLDIRPLSAFSGNYANPASRTNVTESLDRANAYAYYLWSATDTLQLIGGLSYDYLAYPVNTDYSPISAGERDKDQWSPKAGLVWTPTDRTAVRGAYTRSLGGLFYDNSVRLEPTQVAGFTQAYRSLVPESIAGPIAGAEFETFGVALDQRLWRGGYLGITGEILKSEASRTVGVFTKTGALSLFPSIIKAAPGSTGERLEFEEKTVRVAFNQLLGAEWAVGGQYSLTHADLTDKFTSLPPNTLNDPSAQRDATLHQLNLNVVFNHRCGFFARFDSLWFNQDSSDLPDEDFWQFNLQAGYRFLQRRAEVRLGILNLTDRDYRLNPLTLHSELLRSRTFAASFKFLF
jgi:outer membrane receptor protein involved in Fe transport